MGADAARNYPFKRDTSTRRCIRPVVGIVVGLGRLGTAVGADLGEMIVEHGVLDQEFHPTASVRQALDQARAVDGVAWVVVNDPDGDEVVPVPDALCLDRRIMLSAEGQRGHAGLVALRDLLLVSLIELNEAADNPRAVKLQALVGPDRVVAILSGGGSDATWLRLAVQERLGELVPGGPHSGLTMLAALLLVFFNRYERTLVDLEATVEGIAERLFPEPDESILADTYRTGQRVMHAGRAVRPLAQGLSAVASDDRFTADASAHQVMLRLRTAAEALTERVTWAEQSLSSMVSTILGLISQRANDLAARQSVVAQRISAYVLLFAIPNTIFALYGINFRHLPTILTRAYGYPVLLVLTAVAVFMVGRRLQRSGWL